MKTKDSKNTGGPGDNGPLEGISSVIYDEEEPQAHAVPVEAFPMDEGRPSTTNGATRNSSPPMASGHGCDLSLCGSTRLRQLPPGYHFSMSLCGSHDIDLLDSEYPPGTQITLIAIRLCGSMNITVPPGTQVVVRRLLLCGDRNIHVEDDPEQEQPAPRLTLYILSLMGDIRVRSNRTEMGRYFRGS
jgi:hypothetical protein